VRRWLFVALAVGALTMLGMFLPSSAEADLPPGGTFVDDDGSVHEGAIEALVAEGVTNGCDVSGPRFCPNEHPRADGRVPGAGARSAAVDERLVR
jgi:hypothetical protein